MKKLLAVVALSLGLISTSQAFLAVQWQGLDGFVAIDGNTGITQGGGSTIAYLVHSDSGAFHGTDLTAGSFIQGDERILGTIVSVGGAGEDFGTVFTQNLVPEAFESGFIYARVFQAPTSSAIGQPLAGTWYYEGPSVVAANIIDTTAPQFYDMNTGSAGIPGFNTDIVNRQVVVPEPAALALLGLGGIVLAVRRRFVG